MHELEIDLGKIESAHFEGNCELTEGLEYAALFQVGDDLIVAGVDPETKDLVMISNFSDLVIVPYFRHGFSSTSDLTVESVVKHGYFGD